jgi:hypothetical protein
VDSLTVSLQVRQLCFELSFPIGHCESQI